MEERDNKTRIFEETKEALEEKDYVRLKTLSNQTIHTASIHQHPDDIAIAVLIYSISKFLERESYKGYPQWKAFFNKFSIMIDKALDAIRKNQDGYFFKQLNKMRETINKIHGNFKAHAQEVFRKAQINKASRIYEHGISMEKTAKLLGVSIWELAEYAGQTGISDVGFNITLDIKSRVKNALEIFEK